MGSDFVTPNRADGGRDTTRSDLSICDNCGRFGIRDTKRVAVIVDGRTTHERRLCSACLCHVKEQFQLPAPWVGAPPVKVR